MGPPRPPPKPGAGVGNRSTPPPSSPPLPSASQPARTGKIVRIPRTNLTTTPSVKNARPTTTRIPSRKRPTPSPPRDPDTSDPNATRSFGRQRENPNPTPNPPPPSAAAPAVDRPRVWKRRPIQHPSKPEESDPPTKEETKPTEPASVPVEAPKKPPETREEERNSSSLEEGEAGEAVGKGGSFDKVMVEFDELMAKSTAWFGEALGSILGDFGKLAGRNDGKGRLVELVKGSVSQLLEPAERHVEAIGELGKSLEVVVERSRAVEQTSS